MPRAWIDVVNLFIFLVESGESGVNCSYTSADHGKGKGRQVSFILERERSKASYTDWMKQRIESPRGKQIYSHRMSVVDPVFDNIGSNKRLDRFSLRTKAKVQGQWRLYCWVHNIEKLANYGCLTG